MQGNIAQALALTCVGNAYLRGRDVSGFWPDADVFKFTKLCEFRDVREGADVLLAADPHAWFSSLARACKGLRLHHAPRVRAPNQTIPISERESAGFVGGGRAWLIETVGDGRSILWQGFDRVGDRGDPEQKIWLTAYLRAAEVEPFDATKASLLLVSAELDAALVEVAALAALLKNDMGGDWPAVFAAARAALTADTPTLPYYDFARFAGLSPEQQRLWAACVQAWVFGGMGSWNDVSPPQAHAAEYARISDRLFHALCDAICAIANATY